MSMSLRNNVPGHVNFKPRCVQITYKLNDTTNLQFTTLLQGFATTRLKFSFAQFIQPNLCFHVKGKLSHLRQFLAPENPLKTMKNDFCFIVKALSFSIFVLSFWSFKKRLD